MTTISTTEANVQLTINPFKNKAGVIVRTLLQNPQKVWKGTELAETLDLKPRWVNCVLATLESYGHVERSQKGPLSETRIIDMKGLTKHWGTVYRFNQNFFHDYYCTSQDPVRTLKEASQKLGFRWALTGPYAEEIFKNGTGQGIPMAYLNASKDGKKDFNKVLGSLEDQWGFLPVGKHPNIIIIEPRDPNGTFFETQSVKGFSLVSKLQLSLDLGKAVFDR